MCMGGRNEESMKLRANEPEVNSIQQNKMEKKQGYAVGRRVIKKSGQPA